jgi:hypothetical protein
MLTNFFSIFSKINNITSITNKKVKVNTTFTSCPFFKKHFDNYIELSNQKSLEIYKKYNTNTFSKFSVLNKPFEPTISKTYINLSHLFYKCFFLIFLASFSKNRLPVF